MKYALFKPLGDEYPYALERRHEYILEKIVQLWDNPELDVYFTSLLIDTRGGRKGFEEEVFKDIHRLYKFRETERLREAESRHEAVLELERRGLVFNATEFLRAVQQGDRGLVDLFVRGGINVNVRGDYDNSTALQIALNKNFSIIAMILLKAGADVNAPDTTGFTPLLMAAGKTSQGYQEVAEQMVKKGADVNARDPLGWTPLLLAISVGNIDLVKLLLEKGADARIRTRKGESARDLAKKYGHEEIMALFPEIKLPKEKSSSFLGKWL